MKWNWHTLAAGSLSVLAWLVVNVNWGALNHSAVVAAGIVGTIVATFSKPGVTPAAPATLPVGR